MSDGGQEQNIDFTMEKDNLYREESVTDLKAGSIRRLLPIKSDGEDDPSRTTIFVGHAQLMFREGPAASSIKVVSQYAGGGNRRFSRGDE